MKDSHNVYKTTLDTYLEDRLLEWGEWLKTGNYYNIGYPRQSSIAMFAEGRCINQGLKSRPTLDTHEAAEEMEKLVTTMAHYNPLMANCLRRYYLDQLSLRSSAQKMGVSHTQFKLYVQLAKQWLVGRMGDKV